MKEVIAGFILIFGFISASLVYLGAGENRSLGFSNICGDRGTFCFRKGN
jgi:hypothetical protein